MQIKNKKTHPFYRKYVRQLKKVGKNNAKLEKGTYVPSQELSGCGPMGDADPVSAFWDSYQRYLGK